jgi:ABC-type uncharacterized transport system permease subunit
MTAIPVIIGIILLIIVIIIVKKILKARIIGYKCDSCGEDIRYAGICQDCQDLSDQDTCQMGD